MLNQVVLLQKRAIRIVCKANNMAHTNALAKNIGILKLVDINVLQTAAFVYRYLNNSLPTVCFDFIVKNDRSRITYNLRRASTFLIPSYRTCLRENCSLVRFPRIWEAIPQEIQLSGSLNIFKSRLREHLFSNYI